MYVTVLLKAYVLIAVFPALESTFEGGDNVASGEQVLVLVTPSKSHQFKGMG